MGRKKRLDLKTSALFFLMFFISIAVSFLYEGITTIPTEGDSLAYHIPIAISFLNKNIFSPTFYLGFYPGIAEGILSLFILFNIPLNLFNVFSWILLFFVLIKLGKAYNLEYTISLIYSISICSMHGILRWLNSQVIDVWLSLFLTMTLLVLQIFKGTRKQFLLLGLMSGLAVGTKYSGPLFIIILFIAYIDKIRKYFSLLNLFLFFIPFSFFGLSWYIRNLLTTGNPIYPQSLFMFKGLSGWDIFNTQIWEAIVLYPIKMLNAVFAEYNIWPIVIMASLIHFIFFGNKRFKLDNDTKKLIFISLCNLVIFLLLPTTFKYDIIVSSMRYSYFVFIPLLAFLFLYFVKIKKFDLLILIGFCNLLLLPSLSYRPKLIIPLIIITYLFFYYKNIIKIVRMYI